MNIIFTGLVEGEKIDPDLREISQIVVCEPNTAIGSSMLDDDRPIDRIRASGLKFPDDSFAWPF